MNETQWMALKSIDNLALAVLGVLAAWAVLSFLVLPLLSRLLKPRCRHVWVAGDFYQSCELHGACGTIVHMGQFKLICEKCGAGKLHEAALRAKPDGSGELIFIAKGKVTQVTPVPVLNVNKHEYPE